jgi:hypothetical protein
LMNSRFDSAVTNVSYLILLNCRCI